MSIKAFAWSLVDTLYCRTFPYPDWYHIPQDLIDMDSLTDAIDRNVDYGTEAFR